MTYSAALYPTGGETLAEAQYHKYQRIVDRLPKENARVLEIGCGWGGFADHASASGHAVKGITISSEQARFAKERLGDRAEIALTDYREVRGTFDAIASIEMFEAVGIKYWPKYFETIRRCLSPQGVAMVQIITIGDDMFKSYSKRGDYFRHYVFPGGLLPSLAEFKRYSSRAGLVCRDAFGFGKDYARTLREWRHNFDSAENAIRNLGHGEGFVRSWRLYLAMSVSAFEMGHTNVYQVELAHE